MTFIALALLAAVAWPVVRAVRALRTRTRPRRRWLAITGVLTRAGGGALLMTVPALAFGWQAALLWQPDLSILIVLMGALLLVTAAVRLVTLVRRAPNAPQEKPVSATLPAETAQTPALVARDGPRPRRGPDPNLRASGDSPRATPARRPVRSRPARDAEMKRWGTRLHAAIYRLTRGRVLGRVGGQPVLLLETTRRRTGQRRTKPVQYLADSDTFVVVASNAGAARPPAWYLNLRANPHARVEVGPRTVDVRAQEATGQERAELWQRLTAANRYLERAAREAGRDLPLMALVPSTPTARPTTDRS